MMWRVYNMFAIYPVVNELNTLTAVVWHRAVHFPMAISGVPLWLAYAMAISAGSALIALACRVDSGQHRLQRCHIKPRHGSHITMWAEWSCWLNTGTVMETNRNGVNLSLLYGMFFHPWFRYWLVVWRHQSISCVNDDYCQSYILEYFSDILFKLHIFSFK